MHTLAQKALPLILIGATVPVRANARQGQAAAAVFHLGAGFFLLLGVINEDIMPDYTLVLGSMFLAGLCGTEPMAS